jgi:NAD(P)-dependent dehydrogenase (short-subunit alcohol dehydrogenase family)
MDLRGRKALVTGGGTGVGRATAIELARAGCDVSICGRREDKLRETAAAVGTRRPLRLRAADVGDADSVRALFEWIAGEVGSIDLLVNAAGINIRRRSMATMEPHEWDHVLRINASGAYYCMHWALPAMRACRDGVIVNVSSIAGKRAAELGGIAYNASKFAMTGLGTSVGLEERHNGIRVTNIYPGEIDTPILEARPQPVTDEHRARMLKAEDVSSAILFVVGLPPHVHVPELVIKPTTQAYY